jgi:hypothetical protein
MKPMTLAPGARTKRQDDGRQILMQRPNPAGTLSELQGLLGDRPKETNENQQREVKNGACAVIEEDEANPALKNNPAESRHGPAPLCGGSENQIEQETSCMDQTGVLDALLRGEETRHRTLGGAP